MIVLARPSAIYPARSIEDSKCLAAVVARQFSIADFSSEPWTC
jgi:hypothetical protein